MGFPSGSMLPPSLPLRIFTCLALAGLTVAAPAWLGNSPAQLSASTSANSDTIVAPAPDEASSTRTVSEDEVRYGRDIRPILSDRCFVCHGPDASTRKADLRLDSLEFAMADLGDYQAIVPGDLEASELWYRINAEDQDEVMPPPDSKVHALTDAEKGLLRRWIEQGAEYEDHWAFIAPERPATPGKIGAWLPRGDIDRFVHASLDRAGLTPSWRAAFTSI
jgi:uncharacterized membrane protein